jgi:hypothetical protein
MDLLGVVPSVNHMESHPLLEREVAEARVLGEQIEPPCREQ